MLDSIFWVRGLTGYNLKLSRLTVSLMHTERVLK